MIDKQGYDAARRSLDNTLAEVNQERLDAMQRFQGSTNQRMCVNCGFPYSKHWIVRDWRGEDSSKVKAVCAFVRSEWSAVPTPPDAHRGPY
jgi:hypothetical protein